MGLGKRGDMTAYSFSYFKDLKKIEPLSRPSLESGLKLMNHSLVSMASTFHDLSFQAFGPGISCHLKHSKILQMSPVDSITYLGLFPNLEAEIPYCFSRWPSPKR